MNFVVSLLTFLCVLVAVPAWAAVAFDAASSQGIVGNTTNTFSHTTSGSNRFLKVCVAIGPAPVAVSSVTYDR